MAEAKADPRTEPQAAKLRELVRTEGWRTQRRDLLDAWGDARTAFDTWTLDHPGATEAEREAQRRALQLDRFEEDLVQLDRLIASQATRIAAAQGRLDDANWDYMVAEHKKLHPRGCELMAEALRTPPTEWKKILPELQLIAILIERNRADVVYLNRASQLPENLIGLPGFYESVPQLMRFFSLMSGKVMNGLAKRIVVKEPA